MPRPRFSDWILTPTPVTIPGGETFTLTSPNLVYVDLVDTFYPQVFFRRHLGSNFWNYWISCKYL